VSFDEMYDEMLHDEFRSSAWSRGAHATPRPVTRLTRYRSAALVGAGGLACATAGAFLGGLGGYFNLSPAGTHSVTSQTEAVALAAAANAVYHGNAALPVTPAGTNDSRTYSGTGSTGAPAATFAAASGPLLNGSPLQQAPAVSGTSNASAPSGGGSPSGGLPASTPPPPPPGSPGKSGPTINIDHLLSQLTDALGKLTSVPAVPPGGGTGMITPLSTVVSGMAGTLANLDSLMPLPTPTNPGVALPVVSASAPLAGRSTNSAGPSSAAPADKSSTPTPSSTALSAVVASVAPPTGSTGAVPPVIPSLPLPVPGGPGPSIPSLPVVSPVGTLPAPPVVTLPSVTSSGGTTCVSAPTVQVGPVSIGVTKAGAPTGATVCIPS
jgi:hypothetical protein